MNHLKYYLGMHLTPVHTICCVATSSRTYYMQCPLESSAYPEKGVRQLYEGDFHAAARCSQKSSQRLLRILQRRAIMLFAPLTVQCIPDCFSRCPITVRHPASKTPEPTKRPLFLKSAYRIRSLFLVK